MVRSASDWQCEKYRWKQQSKRIGTNIIRRSAFVAVGSLAIFAASIDRRCGPFPLHQQSALEFYLCQISFQRAGEKNPSQPSAARVTNRPKLIRDPTMEPTVTQSSALYLAQHKISKRRTAFFRRWRAVRKNQAPDLRRQTLCNGRHMPRFHRDNGR